MFNDLFLMSIWKRFRVSIFIFMILNQWYLPAMAALPYKPAPAPGFRPELDWINTKGPVRLADFKGKFVIVNFWTYGNVICQAGIVELKRLIREFPNEVVVIGIHSGKFIAERKTENIRKAVLRFGIFYPVGNDEQFRAWSDFNVDVWPTTILIDPDGVEIFRHTGTPLYENIKIQIERFRDYYGPKIDRREYDWPQQVQSQEQGSLFFPTQVLIDEKEGGLYIADSGHQRIVLADLSGLVKDVIGSGEAGDKDGQFFEAAFQDPEGLVWDGRFLYIADRGNNKIKRADLVSRQVSTVKNGSNLNLKGSPWGLIRDNNHLYITLSGVNQIHKWEIGSGQFHLVSGRGSEDVQDGPLLEASFAQPSGIAIDNEMLYIVDSQASAIRQINLLPKGEVLTLVGVNRFEFGDHDGLSHEALLQHPTGVTWKEGELIFCDTYNNKIKILNITSRKVMSLAGDGKVGFLDGSFESARFNGPQGIIYNSGKLYVADTNNHAIRILALDKREVSTLYLNWPDSFLQRLRARGDEIVAQKNEMISGKYVQKVVWRTSQPNQIKRVQWLMHLPLGCRLNPAKLSQIRFFDDSKKLIKGFQLNSSEVSLPLFRTFTGNKLFAEVTLFYVDKNRPAMDYLKQLIIEINLKKGDPKDLFLEIAPLTFATD